MHRLLLGEESIPAKMEIDHINGKPYDNRRSNLRLVTHSDNMKNQAIHADNKSGYANVSKNNGWGKPWTAEITFNGLHYYLGHFDTPEEASRAVEIKRKQISPEFERAPEDRLNGTRRPC